MIPLPLLALETSCDETAAAVIDADGKILADLIYSQIENHSKFGGVVPEIASRMHLEILPELVREAIDAADVEIRSVAVTQGPGLIGSLLVGVSFAKGFAAARGLPLIPVHHIHGHIAALFIDRPSLVPPFLTLVVSGGHTELVSVDADYSLRILSKTVDDAAGEAFDKAARLLGLGFPGGPAVSAAAAAHRGETKSLAGPLMRHSDDFSFSGLKTALRNHVTKEKSLAVESTRRLAAAFENDIVSNLVEKTMKAADKLGVNTIGVVGGVAANARLRNALNVACANEGMELVMPVPRYCTDNAVMIGMAALRFPRVNVVVPWNASASLALIG